MAVKSNHQALFRCTLLSTETDHGETTSHIGVELNQFAALALGADGFLVTHITGIPAPPSEGYRLPH